MGKRKCKQCGKRDDVENMRLVNVMSFCDINCILAYTKQPKVKKAAKVKINAEKKRAFYDDDIKTRKKAAVIACHLYIRTRDKDNGCITCDRPLTGKYDAGHFLKSTNSYTKFMEKNIHGQCVNCNQYNGGREREYEHALVAKYGQTTVDALKRVRAKAIKRTAQDYKQIEDHFKSKLKLLQ